MKLHFYGADRCVTGSCHCLEINGKNILIDCGLQQGRDEISNHEFPFDPTTIPEVNTSLPASGRAIGGLGMHLVRQIMDSVSYQHLGGFNVLTLSKNVKNEK